MSGRCDNCRRRLSGEGRRTATRVLCEECFTQFTGLAAGFLAAGTVDDAISTADWLQRVKDAGRQELEAPRAG
ncbi:hypothetical protein KNO15_12930 [Leifsonia shinshuensis]|uniref:hypothetical protein n=1 Tax=Leifsonia shinshuensis TaxID=150026 RepID=UPI001F504FBD|nr:hypothetical protein [Leifsonia shinshuensis]MCI0157598.1 hypothetical protein [Leifsonia shinshuensis]